MPTKISQFIAGNNRHAPGQEYDYFLPAPILTHLDIDAPVLQMQLERSSHRLGELNALAMAGEEVLPDLSVFIQSFISNEAVLSSRIEGTQTRMEDLFRKEESIPAEKRDDWLETRLYIKALRESIAALPDLPLCNRLIKQAHQTLLSSGRGKNKLPGEFRRSQNWIGGSSVQTAAFVPPHDQHVEELMGDLEKFLNAEGGMPELIRIGIAHYQFETIHPFLDGNGRVGRMLIVLLLVERGLLKEPLIYPSAFFEEHKEVYFSKLTQARTKNDLAGWLLFFLEGVEKSAALGQEALYSLLKLKQDLAKKVKNSRGSRNMLRALDFAFKSPLLSVHELQQALKVSQSTTYSIISELTALGILQKESTQQRNRVFRFGAYLDIFQQPAE